MKKTYKSPFIASINLNIKNNEQAFPVCEPPTLPIGLAIALGRAVARALPERKLKFL